MGFIAIKINNKYTSEIYVVGIEEEYHRKGIGKRLFDEVYKWCKNENYEFLQVKTLDESRENVAYEKTRKFYKAIGFRPLECIPEIWGNNNPCLIMIMKIQ
ncbi:MAG: GNAT family N-acetyltransferase [Clostridium sp.]|nr:GNAT family N-acetyltransferase [Clostridium sp.]